MIEAVAEHDDALLERFFEDPDSIGVEELKAVITSYSIHYTKLYEHLGFNADERDYGVGAQILRSLGVKKMKLMTNNPVKRIGLSGFGLEISENVPLEIAPNRFNYKYMQTKRDRMGHT